MATRVANRIFKLRVVNLPWTVSHLQLKEYFSQFGYVANAKVIFDRNTGLSKFTGYIELEDQEICRTILNKKYHHLEGLDIYCRSWVDSNNNNYNYNNNINTNSN